jgi:hypothetical protein
MRAQKRITILVMIFNLLILGVLMLLLDWLVLLNRLLELRAKSTSRRRRSYPSQTGA